MHNIAKVYRQSSEPDIKIGHLDKRTTDELKAMAAKYKSMLNQRVLLRSLKDKGESLRSSLRAVESQLDKRALDEVVANESTSSPSISDLQKLEWTRVRSTNHDVSEVDMDNSGSLHSTSSASTSVTKQMADKSGLTPSTSVTKQMADKSGLAQRETRFQTNHVSPSSTKHRPPAAPANRTPTSLPASSNRRSTVDRWADSALGTPGGPSACTKLLSMQESLQLLTQSSQQVEDERMQQLTRQMKNVTFADEYRIGGAAAADDIEGSSERTEYDDVELDMETTTA